MTEERLWVFLDVFDDMKKVNIISLGCSKNLVDTEMLLKQLDQAGYDTETDVENSDAEVVIVNTCGFIGDAKEESVNTILEQSLAGYLRAESDGPLRYCSILLRYTGNFRHGVFYYSDKIRGSVE